MDGGALVLMMSLATLATSHSSRTSAHAECLAFSSRRLVYIHIMKCGGLSVDSMMRCRCNSPSTPCALLREDGSAKHAANASGDLVTRFRDALLYGQAHCGGGATCTAAGIGSVPRDDAGAFAANQHAAAQRTGRKAVLGRNVSHEHLLEGPYARCAAQILATHQPVAIVRARPYWSGAHIITVLREPVSRVWSFYQYVRRKSADFQARPLLHFLRRWRTHTPNGSAASAGGGGSPHTHWQLSNHMTAQLGIPNLAATSGGKVRVASAMEAYAARQRAFAAEPITPEALSGLRLAQAALVRMDAVGITEDLHGFERMLAARWPLPFAKSGCRVPSGSDAKNPTAKHPTRGNASTTLDNVTRDAIRSLNRLDIELYAFAKQLATAQGACAQQSSVNTPANTPGRVTSHGNAATRACFEEVRVRFSNALSWQLLATKAGQTSKSATSSWPVLPMTKED